VIFQSVAGNFQGGGAWLVRRQFVSRP
jgi:hypothetical protein